MSYSPSPITFLLPPHCTLLLQSAALPAENIMSIAAVRSSRGKSDNNRPSEQEPYDKYKVEVILRSQVWYGISGNEILVHSFVTLFPLHTQSMCSYSDRPFGTGYDLRRYGLLDA